MVKSRRTSVTAPGASPKGQGFGLKNPDSGSEEGLGPKAFKRRMLHSFALLVSGAVLLVFIQYCMKHWPSDQNVPASNPISMPPPLKLGSRLPAEPLGSFMAFLVVSAAKSANLKHTQYHSGYELEIKAGHFAVNKQGRSIVSSLSISRSGAGQFAFSVLEIELAGAHKNFYFAKSNCMLRIDVASTDDLIEGDQFLVALEKWTFDTSKAPCSIKF